LSDIQTLANTAVISTKLIEVLQCDFRLSLCSAMLVMMHETLYAIMTMWLLLGN